MDEKRNVHKNTITHCAKRNSIDIILPEVCCKLFRLFIQKYHPQKNQFQGC